MGLTHHQLPVTSLHRISYITIAVLICLSSSSATTTQTTATDNDMPTASTIADEDSGTTPAPMETTTQVITSIVTKVPFTIRVPPMEELILQSPNRQLGDYLVEIKDGKELQDIGAEESNSNIFIHFEPARTKPNRDVEVSSFVADSETALDMDVHEAVADVRNRSGGADMISAFFVAPKDEVNANYISRNKFEDRRDLTRPERYSDEDTKDQPMRKMSLNGNVLAPLQAAVSLSQDNKISEDGPILEKQMLQEMPVYKTTIEIQKSVPYEIKGGQMEAVEEEQNKNQAYRGNNPVPPSVAPPIMLAYQLPQYRPPLYYKVPTAAMYYIPQAYIGNYIMRHSHENTGSSPNYFYRPRQYYYLNYQPTRESTFPQSQRYPIQYSPSYAQQASIEPQVTPVYSGLPAFSGGYQNIQVIPAYYPVTPDYPGGVQPVATTYQESNPTAYQNPSPKAVQKYHKVKIIPSPYQNIKTTLQEVDSAPLVNKGYKNDKNQLEDEVSNENDRYVGTSGNEGRVTASYQTQLPIHDSKSIHSTSYKQHGSTEGYEFPNNPGQNIPLNYQTLKIIPAYPDNNNYQLPLAPPYPEMNNYAFTNPETYFENSYRDEDQNSLQSEPIPKVDKSSHPLKHPNLISQAPARSLAPFRPSQLAFSSVYPPYTYKVPLMLTEKTGRGKHARSVPSKQLCVEYGGFKPPMVPSIQIDENGMPKKAEERSDNTEEIIEVETAEENKE